MIQFMFRRPADEWEDTLKSGLVVPLYKMKGDRDDPNNYRGVCLLSMGSRILARVVATRLRKWAEAVHLMDDNQAGFRSGRSMADATQMLVRMPEDGVDLRRRWREEEVGDGDVPTARLLDLRKAYPRVNKPALWRLLERYGQSGRFLGVFLILDFGRR